MPLSFGLSCGPGNKADPDPNTATQEKRADRAHFKGLSLDHMHSKAKGDHCRCQGDGYCQPWCPWAFKEQSHTRQDIGKPSDEVEPEDKGYDRAHIQIGEQGAAPREDGQRPKDKGENGGDLDFGHDRVPIWAADARSFT